jgi:hypothetical protein
MAFAVPTVNGGSWKSCGAIIAALIFFVAGHDFTRQLRL